MDSMLQLLQRLSDAGVEFVVVGGFAAVAHGSSLVTKDVDVCTRFDLPNVTRILTALNGIHPRHRMRPDKLPLADEPARFEGFKNLYVLTDLGMIDFLGELPGWGTFADALEHSESIDFDGLTCRVLELDALIAVKRIAGRPKDLRAVTELECLLQFRKKPPDLPDTQA